MDEHCHVLCTRDGSRWWKAGVILMYGCLAFMVVLCVQVRAHVPRCVSYGVAAHTKYALWHPREGAQYGPQELSKGQRVVAFEPHINPDVALKLSSWYARSDQQYVDTCQFLGSMQHLVEGMTACSFVATMYMQLVNNELMFDYGTIGPCDIVAGACRSQSSKNYRVLAGRQHVRDGLCFITELPCIHRTSSQGIFVEHQRLFFPCIMVKNVPVYATSALGNWMFDHEPRCSFMQLDQHDHFILLASSTFWRHISYDAATWFVSKGLDDFSSAYQGNKAQAVADALAAIFKDKLSIICPQQNISPFYLMLLVFDW